MGLRRYSNLDWAVAWDSTSDRQTYLRHADLTVDADRIVALEPHRERSDAAEWIDGRGLMALPGLIDLHAHPSLEPLFRGIREDHGVPEHYMSGLFERSQAYWPDEDAMLCAAEAGLSELLLSGVTTVLDISFPFRGWLDVLARSGIRAYAAPAYASASWNLTEPHAIGYRWHEDGGRASFLAALELVDAAMQHPCGRLLGAVSPAQIDTCTEALLRDSYAAARERAIPFTVHASQSVNEFLEMTRRHGVTPIQFAARLGLLGERSILGHALFVDEHSWVRWHTRDDIHLLGETGSAVAHCPSTFARYGQGLEDLGRYRRAGVTVGFGTDVAPHNMIEEMRLAAIMARVGARDVRSAATGDVFEAATLGGARALGRGDLGRLAPGAKADFVLVDLSHPFMRPARDPLRSLVFGAADRAVRDVFVDGRPVVRDGKVIGIDLPHALDRLDEAQQRMERSTPSHDPRGRSSLRITPLSLPKAGAGDAL